MQQIGVAEAAEMAVGRKGGVREKRPRFRAFAAESGRNGRNGRCFSRPLSSPPLASSARMAARPDSR